MNLGEKIYELRIKQNMSQGDLAELLGVSRQSISKWENNSAVPEIGKLIQMSEIFHVTLDELVQGMSPNRVEEKQNNPANPWEEKWLGIRKKNWFNFLGYWIVGKMLYTGCTQLSLRIENVISGIFLRAQNIYGTNPLLFAFKEYNKWIFLVAILYAATIIIAFKFLKVIIMKNDMKDKINKGIHWVCWYWILYGSSALVEDVSISILVMKSYPTDVMYLVTHAIMILGGAVVLLWEKYKREDNKFKREKDIFVFLK